MSITAVKPKTITVHAVRAVLRDIARTHPSRRDRRALDGQIPRYVERGRPACLVAVVLHRLGYSTAILRSLDNELPPGELTTLGAPVATSRHRALGRIEPAARDLLQHLQDAQRRGSAWGRVIDRALTRRFWIPRRWEQETKPWLFV